MGDQAAGIVDHEGVASFADPDGRDYIPDKLQINVGDGDSGCRSISRDGHRHVRFGFT